MANSSTIIGNFCNLTFTGCGIYVDTGSTGSIANTILAQNYQRSKFAYVPDDCNAVTSGDYNLIQTTAGCTIGGATANNITAMDPNVGLLQYNGGPTQTIALLAGSLAIDTGRPPPSGCNGRCPGGFLTTDQRGWSPSRQRALRHGSLRIRSAATVLHDYTLPGRRHANRGRSRARGRCRS